MITRNLKSLLRKLDDHTTRALEAAAGFCISRTHYEVTVEHLLLKLIEEGTGDVPHVLRHYGIEPGRVADGLLVHLESFRTGNAGRPAFSPLLLRTIEAAWLVGSVHHAQTEVRSGHLLEALLGDDASHGAPYMDLLDPIERDHLREHFVDVVGGSVEDRPSAHARGDGAAGAAPRAGSTALDRYTLNVTARAREGGIDPIVGRDKEIRQMIDILSRRRKNNPILVGEAGVGKTAVLEGLALRIAEADVPSELVEVDIHTLDLGLLQAGAGVKGEFESRLKSVIDEVKEAAKPIILFIDEAHTLIGAGGAAGTGDAANMLKPALARGELRTVAATTWSEYKKYIEKDPALERRFQLVKIDEPDAATAALMLRGIRSRYEDHHGVQITDEAVRAAAELSDRFISGRQLPDKAVDLLDTAAARVKMSQTARPPQVDDLVRRLGYLRAEIDALERDRAAGVAADEEAEAVRAGEREALERDRTELEARWEREAALVRDINALRDRLAEASRAAPAGGDGEPATEAQAEELARLAALQHELAEVQGESPMVHADVNAHVAAQVISDWTGIPVGNMLKDEAQVLLDMETRLREQILGQDEAISQVAETIRTAKAGLGNPDAPLAVFLFVGPSGVGKTEMGLRLADLLFGGERFLTTINMSEYQEAHTVSQLKGSPPGYVGYGEGGVLTEAVRQRPYSVLLLDEVEKAHRDVMNLFYQVFDRGAMRDGEGRDIDFRNTVIIMTSNLASDVITYTTTDEERPTPDQLREAIHSRLVAHFQPALLARMKVVPFYALGRETMRGIVGLKLGKIERRLRASHAMRFDYDPEVAERIAERCTQVDAGARNVDFIIDRTLLPEASRALIAQMVQDEDPAGLTVGLDEAGDFTYTFA